MANKQLLSDFLSWDDNRNKLDSAFLSIVLKDNCQCPVHHLPLIIEDGFKSIPDRSLDQEPEEQNPNFPYALCWTRSPREEKHGAVEPAPIVYCAMCNRERNEQEREHQKIFSRHPNRVYRL